MPTITEFAHVTGLAEAMALRTEARLQEECIQTRDPFLGSILGGLGADICPPGVWGDNAVQITKKVSSYLDKVDTTCPLVIEQSRKRRHPP